MGLSLYFTVASVNLAFYLGKLGLKENFILYTSLVLNKYRFEDLWGICFLQGWMNNSEYL